MKRRIVLSVFALLFAFMVAVAVYVFLDARARYNRVKESQPPAVKEGAGVPSASGTPPTPPTTPAQPGK